MIPTRWILVVVFAALALAATAVAVRSRTAPPRRTVADAEPACPACASKSPASAAPAPADTGAQPVASNPPPPAAAASPSPPATRVPKIADLFRLDGTFAGKDPRSGLAVLTRKVDGNTVLLASGAALPGAAAHLDEIYANRVVVKTGDGAEILWVGNVASGEPAPEAGTATAGMSLQELLSKVGQPGVPTGDLGRAFQTREDPASPNTWLLDPVEKQVLRHCVRALCDEVEVAPVLTEMGTVEGLRIVRIDPKSILTERGLRAGDILQKMNGVPFNPHKDAEEWLMGVHLDDLSFYTLEIERQGQPLLITFRLTDF